MPGHLTPQETTEVTVSLPTESKTEKNGLLENHPLRSSFGIFRDDPYWDEFMENIREYRRQLDAQELEREKEAG